MTSVSNMVGDLRFITISFLTFYQDILIVEDDPYYFLQEGPYQPKSERAYVTVQGIDEEAAYVASLAPSYVK